MPVCRLITRRKRGLSRNFLDLLRLGVGLLLAASFAGRVQAAPTHDFLILYSNNVHGEIEPCG